MVGGGVQELNMLSATTRARTYRAIPRWAYHSWGGTLGQYHSMPAQPRASHLVWQLEAQEDGISTLGKGRDGGGGPKKVRAGTIIRKCARPTSACAGTQALRNLPVAKVVS